MKPSTVGAHLTARSLLLMTCVLMAVIALLAALPLPAYAGPGPLPPVPENIQPPDGHVAYLVGHAIGTQNYICLPSETGYRFTLFTPQATLFHPKSGKQIITHYFSPNPDQGGTIRPAWQHSRDSSTVWGQVMPGNASTDPAYVAADALPWLLLTVVGAEPGPRGGDALTRTTYIQRVNTTGGLAPSTGCSSSTDVGNQAYVPYTADYIFFREGKGK